MKQASSVVWSVSDINVEIDEYKRDLHKVEQQMQDIQKDIQSRKRILSKIDDWITKNSPVHHSKSEKIVIIFNENGEIKASGVIDPTGQTGIIIDITSEIVKKQSQQQSYSNVLDLYHSRCGCGGEIETITLFSGGTVAGGDYGTYERICNKCSKSYGTHDY